MLSIRKMYHLWRCIRKINQHHRCRIQSIFKSSWVLNTGWIIDLYCTQFFIFFPPISQKKKKQKTKQEKQCGCCPLCALHYCSHQEAQPGTKTQQNAGCRMFQNPEQPKASHLTLQWHKCCRSVFLFIFFGCRAPGFL